MAKDFFVKPSFYDVYNPEKKEKVVSETEPEVKPGFVKLQNTYGEVVDVEKDREQNLLDVGYNPITPEQKKRIVLEKKYGGTGQEFLAGIEGAGDAASFSLINRAENAIGEALDLPELTFEAQEARKLVNPKAALTGQVLGTAAMIYGTGGFGAAGAKTAARVGLGSELAALKTSEKVASSALKAGLSGAKAAELAGAARAAKLAEYSVTARIGSRAVANAIEGAIYASGQEAVKTVFQDPNQSLGSAATNIGLYGLLGGGATGAAFAGAGELWNATFGNQTKYTIAEINKFIRDHSAKSQLNDPLINPVQQGQIIPETEIPISIESGTPLQTPVIGERISAFGRKANADDIEASAKRLGLKPVTGMLDADDRVANEADVLSETFSAVGNKLKNEKLEFNNRLQKIVDDDLLVDRSPPSVGSYEVGKFAKEDIESFYEKAKTELSKRYSAEKPHLDAANLNKEITGKAIANIRASQFYKRSNKELKREINEVFNQIKNLKNLTDLKELNTINNNNITKAYGAKDNNLALMLTDVKRAFKQMRNEGILNSAQEIAGKEGDQIANKFIENLSKLDADYAAYKRSIEEFTEETGTKSGRYAGNLDILLDNFNKMSNESFAKKLINTKDRDQLLYLQRNFPKVFDNLRRFKIKEIYNNAKSSAQGSGNKLIISSVIDQIDELDPVMKEMFFANKGQLLQDLDIVYKALPPKFNTSNTGPATSYLKEFATKLATEPTKIYEAVLSDAGYFTKYLLMQKGSLLNNLTKNAGNDKAAEVGIAKLLTATDRDPNASSFKIMVDYIRQVLKGQTNTNRAIDNLMKGAPIIIPQHLKPDEKVKEKLDKRVKEFGENPSAMLDTLQDFNHYMSDHGMAIAAASANAVNYLNTIRPVERRESPLDDPTPPSQFEKQNYDVALSVAQQPLMILEDIKDGTLNSIKLGHLQNLYPDFYANMRFKMMNELVNVKAKGEKIPYKTRMGLSLFLGTPLDSTMKPEGIMALQPKMAQAQQQAMMPMQQAALGGGRQRGTMKNIGKLADQQLTPMQTRIMEKQSVKV
jgi:hypothetical protein